MISNWFLERDNKFTVLKWPPQSRGLSPIEHLLGGGGVYPVKKLVYFGVMNEKRNKDCFLVVLEPLEGV